MSRRAIKREFYDNLVAAFREAPGVATLAAKRAGCDTRTAKRAWKDGWSPSIPWARPIRTVIEEEQEAARAAQRRMEEDKSARASDDRDKARDDAVKALAQEGQMLALARSNATATLASVALMQPILRRCGEEFKRHFEKGAIPPAMCMRIAKDISYVLRNLAVVVQSLIEGERQSKGEPSAVIGLQVEGGLSIDEAIRELAEVSELYELAKRRGLVEGQGAPTLLELAAAEPSRDGTSGNGGQVH